jgi:hypothetical protein
MKYIASLLIAFACHAQAQFIVLDPDNTFTGLHPGTYVGAVNTNPDATVATGTAVNTIINLSPAQLATFNAFASANKGVLEFAYNPTPADGTSYFTVAPIEQLRLGLLSIFSGLQKWEQAIYAPQLTAVAGRIAVGDVAGVQGIITNSGAGMPTDIATARTAMLALITQLYGATPPAVNN